MIYLSNAFSIQMLKDCEKIETVRFEKITTRKVKEILANKFISCIGHKETVNVLNAILKMNIEVHRTSIALEKGDILVVAQITSGRLPENCTTLPDNCTLEFFKAQII